MPRYLIERTFQESVDLPGIGQPDKSGQTFIDNNSLDGVTWVHSYIVPGMNKSYCIYNAPNPEAVRRAAIRNGIPVDRIIDVLLLAPYMFPGEED
jgi:hypothetical protein